MEKYGQIKNCTTTKYSTNKTQQLHKQTFLIKKAQFCLREENITIYFYTDYLLFY